jgi:2-amino-4-hydroxy-6-hydroxymethyldihydropteridine diphosphokinase
MTHPVAAYVGIGSNLGDSRARVLAAFNSLAGLPDCKAVAQSRLYRTQPIGPVIQQDFVNAVLGMQTTLPALQLLQHLRALEIAGGRIRGERWGPRSLDLDLLVYGSQHIETPELVVPHPGIAARGFVLAPLADIAPDLQIPGVGRVGDLLRRLPGAGIVEVLPE